MYLLCKKYIGYLQELKLIEIKNINKQVSHYTIPEFDLFADMTYELEKIGCLTSTVNKIISILGDGMTQKKQEKRIC